MIQVSLTFMMRDWTIWSHMRSWAGGLNYLALKGKREIPGCEETRVGLAGARPVTSVQFCLHQRSLDLASLPEFTKTRDFPQLQREIGPGRALVPCTPEALVISADAWPKRKVRQ